jgi:hypothetical protein
MESSSPDTRLLALSIVFSLCNITGASPQHPCFLLAFPHAFPLPSCFSVISSSRLSDWCSRFHLTGGPLPIELLPEMLKKPVLRPLIRSIRTANATLLHKARILVVSSLVSLSVWSFLSCLLFLPILDVSPSCNARLLPCRSRALRVLSTTSH